MIQKIHRKIIAFRIRNHQTVEGFLAPLEAIGLYKYASRLGPDANIVEIGSWKGKSTYCLAIGLAKGTVFAIDPFDASGEQGSAQTYDRMKGEQPLLDQFKHNMKTLGVLDKIHVLQGFSKEFIGKVNTIDLLFIDGNHSIEACQFDYEQYAPNLNIGGFLLFHDFNPTRKELGPTWVIENLVIPSQQYEFCELIGSLWIGKKIVD